MSRPFLWLVLLAAPLAASPAAGADAGAVKGTSVAVPVGQQKTVAAPGYERVALDDTTVAAVVTKGDQLVITGLRDGTTTLWVYKKTGSPSAYLLKVGTGKFVEGEGDAGVSSAIAGKPIELKPGAEMLLRLPGALEGLAVADPEVAEARLVGNNQVVVQGVSPGQTTTIVFGKDGKRTAYNVTVVGAPGGDGGGRPDAGT